MQGVASYQPSLQGRIRQQKPAVRPYDTKVRHSMSVNAVLKMKQKDVQQQSNSYELKFIISHKKNNLIYRHPREEEEANRPRWASLLHKT